MSTYANPDGSFTNQSAGGPVTVVVPTTGSTVAMAYNGGDLYVANAATLDALTINLPTPSHIGHKVEILTKGAVTALTIKDHLGNSPTTAPSAGYANSMFAMRWLGAANGWVQWNS